MTKKSAARLARDQAQKDLATTSCWTDVNDISNKCEQLLASCAALHPSMRDPQLLDMVEDKALLAKNLRILSGDLGKLSTELQGLKKLHAGKTGTASDPQELITSINIFEQYMMFIERHDALVMPTANHIAEQLEVARRRMVDAANTAPLKPEQDPAIITDVEAKAV